MSKLGMVIDFINAKGLTEFDPMQDYKPNAVVTYQDKIYIALQEVKAANVECCQPVEPPECNSKWAYLINCHEFNLALDSLTDTMLALEKRIIDLRGLEEVTLEANLNSGNLELTIKDTQEDNIYTIPLDKLGLLVSNSDGSFLFKNANGTSVTIPAHQAKTKIVNSGGNNTLGYIHQTSEIHGVPTNTINLVQTTDLSLTKGFRFNVATNQWEIDLSGVLDSSLTWDNGRLRVSDNFKLERNNYVNNAINELDRIIQSRETDLLSNANSYTDTQTRFIHTQFTELLRATRDALESSDRNIRDLLADTNNTLNQRINQLSTDLGAQLNNVTNTLRTEVQTIKSETLKELEKFKAKMEESCKVPIKNVGTYTLVEADNVIISSGGTITIPQGLPVGRLFTVIQSSNNLVNILGSTGVTVIPPFEGSTVLAGINASVTIMITGNDQARIFGQTEN